MHMVHHHQRRRPDEQEAKQPPFHHPEPPTQPVDGVEEDNVRRDDGEPLEEDGGVGGLAEAAA